MIFNITKKNKDKDLMDWLHYKVGDDLGFSLCTGPTWRCTGRTRDISSVTCPVCKHIIAERVGNEPEKYNPKEFKSLKKFYELIRKGEIGK